MDKARFERLVAEAVESLPAEFREKLENVDVVVEYRPSARDLADVGLSKNETLFGLYQGVPRTGRSPHYGLVVPDKITIYQRPIEAECQSDTEVRGEIRRTVRHEIAHHFGIGDTRLQQLDGGED
jgi:predicted Zn-dependent protease with MMP-like domain